MSKIRAFNNFYIVEEEAIENCYDAGMSKETLEAVKSGLIVLPDIAKNFMEKYPCRGKVISKGEACKFDIKVGDRVIYARLGVQRYEFEGKILCDVRECDIHAVID